MENQFYRVHLSLQHGGTIRHLEFNGINMKVIREGCEYWEPNSPNHYEQEFSSTAEIEIIDKGVDDYYLMLEVKARLVSPQLKTDGGECRVWWLFRRDSPIIYSDYQITPTEPQFKSDRYICFSPSAFDKYSFMEESGELIHGEIEFVDGEPWSHDFPDVKWGAVHDGKTGVTLASASKPSNITFYKSFSMIEVKMGYVGGDGKELCSVYFPLRVDETPDEALIREARLKSILIRLCMEMREEDSSADWFNRTLREHSRGIWFLRNWDNYLRKGMKVLDIGGGIGAWGAYLNYVDELKLDYINVDISESRIETSKRLFDELGIDGRFMVCDWRKTFIEKQDVVLCFGALYYFNRYIFRIANNLLEQGGLFIFEAVEKTTNGPEGYDYALTIPEVKAELENAGFEVVRIEYCAEHSTFNDIVAIGRKKWDGFYIKNQGERDALMNLAHEIVDEDDSNLVKASKLSSYCKENIDFPLKLPENLEWYEASGYETLTRWRLGNCLNYTKALISLASSFDMEGRTVWIHGDVVGYKVKQGHALCELKIDGKWVLFDSMYGVPFLDRDFPEIPSAYECWIDPERYMNIMNPEYRRYSDDFWREIWFNFHIYEGKSIRELGEEAFIERWYDVKEMWWYTTFRDRLLNATDEEMPQLYRKLYYEYLYKKGHSPTEIFTPFRVINGKFIMRGIPNTYRFVRILMKQFGEDMKVLELGCGLSSFPFILATDGYDVTAIDIREGVVACQRKFINPFPLAFQEKLRFEHALAEALPYHDNSFDIIIGVDFIEHIRDPDRLLTECSRVLKPDGRMFFTTPIKGIEWSPEHLHNFTRENLEELFISNGFKTKFYTERYYWQIFEDNTFVMEVENDV